MLTHAFRYDKIECKKKKGSDDMPWFYLAFGLLGALVAWAVYLFLRRAVRAFGAEVRSLKIKLILWGSAVAVGIASLAFQRFSVPILFHFFLFARLFQFGNFLFKKLAHKHYENGFALISLLKVLRDTQHHIFRMAGVFQSW